MIHSVRYHVPGQNVLVPHLHSSLVLGYYVHMQSVESVGHVNLSGIRIASRLASGWTRIRHFSEIEKKRMGQAKETTFLQCTCIINSCRLCTFVGNPLDSDPGSSIAYVSFLCRVQNLTGKSDIGYLSIHSIFHLIYILNYSCRRSQPTERKRNERAAIRYPFEEKKPPQIAEKKVTILAGLREAKRVRSETAFLHQQSTTYFITVNGARG